MIPTTPDPLARRKPRQKALKRLLKEAAYDAGTVRGADTDVEQDAVSIALDKLAALPRTGAKDMVAVPFPVAPRLPAPVRPRDLHGAHHRKIALADLHALQPLVKAPKVARFIAQDGDFRRIPVIVKARGVAYIYNGHHRCTADYLLGKTHVKATVLDLGQPD